MIFSVSNFFKYRGTEGGRGGETIKQTTLILDTGLTIEPRFVNIAKQIKVVFYF